MFYKHLACPHWLYFDVYGDQKLKKPNSAFTEKLIAQGVEHEEKILGERGSYVEVKARGNPSKFKKTLALMKEGAPRIYHGLLMDGDMVGEPDLLERRDDRPSDLGPYHYVAIDIKSAEELNDAHRFQLVCYGELLKAVQGARPEDGYVLNRSGALLSFSLRESEQQFHAALEEVRRILGGEVPPPQVSSGCKQSPWFDQCIALAEKENDVALLYNVRKKAVKELREKGVRTVDDVLHIDIERLADGSEHLSKRLLERMVLQARALKEKRHFIRRPIDLPDAPLEIFFDIEGDPLEGIEYLFGFWVRPIDESAKYEYQLAEHPKDEEKMWREFLDWIETLKTPYVVYHYGIYERVRLESLEKKYGGSKALARFADALVDLNETVKDCVVFPLYFYGLKQIGSYIGFSRKGKIEGGGESIAVYEQWLKTRDRKHLKALLAYNRDDVAATAALKDWLAAVKENGRMEE